MLPLRGHGIPFGDLLLDKLGVDHLGFFQGHRRLGLRSGRHPPAPSSVRECDEISVILGLDRSLIDLIGLAVSEVKFGLFHGVPAIVPFPGSSPTEGWAITVGLTRYYNHLPRSMSRDRGDNVNTQLKTTNQWSRLRRQVRRHPEFSEDEVRLTKIHRADIQKNLATRRKRRARRVGKCTWKSSSNLTFVLTLGVTVGRKPCLGVSQDRRTPGTVDFTQSRRRRMRVTTRERYNYSKPVMRRA